jgi:hypothetical protein
MSAPATPSTVNFIQAQPFTLAGSGTSIGDVTILLNSMYGIDGATTIVTADLGSYAFATIEPGNGTNEEAIIFTGVTQNANGTATLTGVSSIGFKQPYTVTTGLAKTHAGASKLVLSNDAAFYNNFTLYLNAIAGAGAANASTAVKGLAQAATTAQINAGTATGSTGAVLFMTPDAFATSSVATAAAIVGINASSTVRGIVQEATATQINNGTATGSTGAELYLNPAVPGSYPMGISAATVAKTYFNTHLPFVQFMAQTSAGSPTFPFWTKTSAVTVPSGGLQALFQSTGSASINVIDSTAMFYTNNTTGFAWNSSKVIIMDWFAKWDSASSGDVSMGFADTTNGYTAVYNSTSYMRAMFTIRQSDSKLYATTSLTASSVTNTDITGSLTLTNWNHYRVEWRGTSALFYVNGSLLATVSTSLPNTAATIEVGFGRSNTALFEVTAPNVSIQMI